jgi:hypothetical protein
MSHPLTKSLPTKRKIYKEKKVKNNDSSDSISDTEELSYLIEYDDYEEFSVVNEHQIKLSSLDLNTGIVKFKGKAYQVTILAKGTLRQMNYKAEKYINNKSLVTTDNEYSESKIRKSN